MPSSSSQVLSSSSPTLEAQRVPAARGSTNRREIIFDDTNSNDSSSEYAEDYHDHERYQALVAETARMSQVESSRSALKSSELDVTAITPRLQDAGTTYFIYQLYLHGEANCIDIQEVMQELDLGKNVEVMSLAYETEADLGHYRFTSFASKFVEPASQGRLIGLVCTHPHRGLRQFPLQGNQRRRALRLEEPEARGR